MKAKKKLELGQLLDHIKQGSNPSKICKVYDIPKSSLSFHVDKLKKLGCVEKVGYGAWRFIKDLKDVRVRPIGRGDSQSRTSKKREIRGHAFIWKINFFNEEIDWKDKLNKVKYNYQLIGHGKVFRIIFDNRKIWLIRSGMIIYEPLDFVGRSSFEVKGSAVYEMDLLVKRLLKKLRIKQRPYRFTTSREHYGIMKNELAKQYNEKKEKLYIKSEEGKTWMWIDDSHSLSELENNEAVTSRRVQTFWNDHKKHKFQVTPSFVLGAINSNTQHLEYHAENMRAHVGAIKDLGTGVKKYTELAGKLTDIVEKILEKLK